MKKMIGVLSLSYLSLFAQADVQKGEQLYKQVCVVCHGDKLQGGIGPTLTDHVWKHGDTKAEIMKNISKGIDGTEMMAFGNVFPNDIASIADFILSKQTGMRELKVKHYDLDPSSLEAVMNAPASLASKKEKKSIDVEANTIYFQGNEGKGNFLLKAEAKLYVAKAGNYEFSLEQLGKTKIFVDGKELLSTGAVAQKKANNAKSSQFSLSKGVHEIKILHAKVKGDDRKLRARFTGVDSGVSYKLYGSPLGDLSPMVVYPGSKARLFRRRSYKFKGNSLWVSLPNETSFIFEPMYGRIAKAWHGGFIDSTPIIGGRGNGLMNFEGQSFSPGLQGVEVKGGLIKTHNYLASIIKGENFWVQVEFNGVPYNLKFSPKKGSQGFTVDVHTKENVQGITLTLNGPVKVNGKSHNGGTVTLSASEAKKFKIEVTGK